MPLKKKQGQKQKQRQSQTVKVVVNLAEKKKRKVKRRVKRGGGGGSGMTEFQLRAPQIIYYQADTTGYMKPPSVAPSVLTPSPPAPTLMSSVLPPESIDVGVGRHGIEQIYSNVKEMDETLTEFEKKMSEYNRRPAFTEIRRPPKSMTEGLIEENVNFQTDIPVAEIVPKRTRRTKKEMEENRSMIKEDISSYNLRLAQFEPAFKPMKDIETSSIVSGITQSEIPTETENIYTSFKKDTWNDLLMRYKNLTGEKFIRRKGYLKEDFKKLVERMESEI